MSFPEMGKLAEWLEMGMDGALAYMRQHREVRQDPRLLVPGARSVLVAVKSYLRVDGDGRRVDGPVSAHAAGRDYHTLLKKRLWEVGRLLTEAGGRFKLFVDSAPVMEKVLAARAGLGRIGRNSLLVHPELGSWVVVGGLATDLDLGGEAASETSLEGCRACRRCVDACPAGAISHAGVVDAGKCLSYWTIECAGSWPERVSSCRIEKAYGCDCCQEACPENRGAYATGGEDFGPFPFDGLTVADLAGWDPARFRSRTRRSSMRRVRFEQFHRNAAACASFRPGRGRKR